MGLLDLFGARCYYCTKKIESEPHIRNVKVLGRIGTKPLKFCSAEHADTYEREVERAAKRSKSSGGGCCG